MPSTGSRRAPASATLATILIAMIVLASGCATTKGTGGGTTSTSTSSSSSTRGSTSTTRPASRPPGWSAPESIAHGIALGAVKCPEVTSCVALGDGGQAYRYVSGRWSGATQTGGASGATGPPSLSCAGPRFCMAVWAGTDDAVPWNGTSWSAPMSIAGAQVLQAVGCASSTFCVAVDGVGDGFYFNGSGWSAQPNDWGSVVAISCPTAAFCVSVKGGVSVWNGSSWTQPQVYGTTSTLTDVSCPLASFSAAVDSTGEAIVWNGSRWSAASHLESGSTAFSGPSLTGVSCTGASFCMAVDGGGRVFTWSGRSWSAPVSVAPGHAFTAVSCTTPSFCVVTDKQGFVSTRT